MAVGGLLGFKRLEKCGFDCVGLVLYFERDDDERVCKP